MKMFPLCVWLAYGLVCGVLSGYVIYLKRVSRKAQRVLLQKSKHTS